MADNTLLITVIVLLAGVLISGFLKSREKDPVLKSFDGFQVTLETVNSHLVWGEMTLHATGMELIYSSDVQDEHHIETSFILYKDEFPQIQAIYRYCDEMGGEQWKKRERELQRAFHPSFWQRFKRRSRNFVNLISESLSQAVGILVGYAQVSTKRITAGSDQYLSKVSASIIGYVGTKFDPLLERYVGTRVVVEVAEGGVVHEHVGVLKDYSADYLQILDVHYPNQAAVEVSQEQECHEDRNMRIRREGLSLYVTNIGERSLYLESMQTGDINRPLNAVLDKDDELELHLPTEVVAANIKLSVKVVRHLDWILPRAHALVRHKAERYDPDQVFDIGVLLKRDRYTNEEEHYLKILKGDPENAESALELGRLLFQRGMLEEAQRWYMQALRNSASLPDGGKLAARQLRQIELTKAARKREP